MSTLDRDDAMLDGLGLGGAAHADDPLAGMLAAWRTHLAEPPFAPTLDLDIAAQAELADPLDLDEDDVEEPAATALRPAASSSGNHVVAAGGPATAARRGAVGATRPPGRRGGPARPVRGARLRPGRLLLAAALLVAVLGGGVVVGAGAGQPGTPLWPVTQLVYAERADSRVAAQETAELLARADRALREQRPGEAEQLLRQAWDLLGQVREESDHQRLRTELMRLLAAFAAVTAPPNVPSASPTPGSSPRPAGGTTTPTSAPTGAPAPSLTPGAGGLLPGLPPLLPSLPPTLPSLLPDLPLL